ncbi:MAG: type II toxin-antitoxin system VapC family toxin [Nocardioides sp.]
MIIDSSALVAILHDEAEAAAFVRVMEQATTLKMSTCTALEVYLVERPGRADRLDDFLAGAQIELVAFDVEQLRLARSAHVRFGRGCGHPAKLNFGDCFSYALAKTTGEPLLFKGDDFTHTDVQAVLSG